MKGKANQQERCSPMVAEQTPAHGEVWLLGGPWRSSRISHRSDHASPLFVPWLPPAHTNDHSWLFLEDKPAV